MRDWFIFGRKQAVVLGGVAILMAVAGCQRDTAPQLYNKGMQAYTDRDVIGASLYFSKFIEKYPDDPAVAEVRVALGDCYVAMGQRDIGQVQFEKVINEFPGREEAAAASQRLAIIYDQQKKPEEALKMLTKVRQDMKLPEVRTQMDFDLAARQVVNKEMTQAAAIYRSILADPSASEDLKPTAMLYLSKCYLASASTEQGLKIMEELRQKYPTSDLVAWSWVDGASYVKDKDPAQAEQLLNNGVEAYEQIISASPASDRAAWAATKIGDAYAHLGEKDKALAQYQQVTKKYAQNPHYVQVAEAQIKQLSAPAETGSASPEAKENVPGSHMEAPPGAAAVPPVGAVPAR